MTEDDVSELAANLKFGDKVIFKHHFQKWRQKNNLPLTSRTSQNLPISNPISRLPSSDSQSENNAPQITVLEILRDHKIGLRIIQNYDKLFEITDKDRVMIIDIIVHYFHSKSSDLTLQMSYQLEKEITQIFPTEKVEYYRTERRGKIYAKYHNKKQFSKPSLNMCNEPHSTTPNSSKLPGKYPKSAHNRLLYS